LVYKTEFSARRKSDNGHPFATLCLFTPPTVIFNPAHHVFQLENELHSAQQRVAVVTEDKNRIEDRLSAIEAAHCLAQDQAAQLQVLD